MTRRRSRLRWTLKWAGLVACVVFAIVCVLGTGQKAGYVDRRGGWAAVLMDRCFVLVHADAWGPYAADGWFLEQVHERAHPLVPPFVRSLGGGVFIVIPFWVLLLAVALPTALLWHRDRCYPAGHCQGCGYDLTGNVTGVCSECGQPHSRPPQRRWLIAAVIPTLLGVTVMVAFRIALAARGIRLYDLWNAARPLSGLPKAGAVNFVGVGSTLATTCFFLAAFTLLYGIVLVVVACLRRDWKAVTIVGGCIVMSVVSGLLAFQLGLVIAGV